MTPHTKPACRSTSPRESEAHVARAVLLGLALAIMCILTAHDAQAFGIAPSRELAAFAPGSHTYTVRIINSERVNASASVYLAGDLAPYATLSTNLINVREDQDEIPFSYTINLPESGLDPGEHTLDVRVVQLPAGDVLPQEKSMVFVGLLIDYQLKVQVPYPGLYAEGVPFVGNAQVGANVPISVAIYNKGKQAFTATGKVTIKGPTNEDLGSAQLSSASVDVGGQGKLEGAFSGKLNAGMYTAEIVVDYDGKQMVLTKQFYVGDLYVDIKNIQVKDFKLGSIAKFDVAVENKWNQPLEDVYGVLSVLDASGASISSFKTGTTTLKAYGSDTISGFWDTAGVNSGDYDVKFALHYSDKQSEKLVHIRVGIDSIVVTSGAAGQVVGSQLGAASGGGGFGGSSIMTILVIILIIVNIGWFVFFKRLRKPGPPGAQ